MVLIENQEYLCEEEKRLKEDRERQKYWKHWGSYVAERQWATGQSTLLHRCARSLTCIQCAKITRESAQSTVLI